MLWGWDERTEGEWDGGDCVGYVMRTPNTEDEHIGDWYVRDGRGTESIDECTINIRPPHALRGDGSEWQVK